VNIKRLRTILLWFCAAMTLAWVLLLVPTLLWWTHSLLWVIIMSWWANVAASGAFWWAIVTFKEVERQGK
jgi:hypothetical protein